MTAHLACPPVTVIRELKQRCFWASDGNRKGRHFPVFKNLSPTQIVLPSVFTLIGTIFPKNWAKPLPKNTKNLVPAVVRRKKNGIWLSSLLSLHNPSTRDYRSSPVFQHLWLSAGS